MPEFLTHCFVFKKSNVWKYKNRKATEKYSGGTVADNRMKKWKKQMKKSVSDSNWEETSQLNIPWINYPGLIISWIGLAKPS